jgi:hypothetical protein
MQDALCFVMDRPRECPADVDYGALVSPGPAVTRSGRECLHDMYLGSHRGNGYRRCAGRSLEREP